jgi:hypothetical protein
MVAQRYIGIPHLFLNNTVSKGDERRDLTPETTAAILGGICIQLLDRMAALDREIKTLKRGLPAPLE